MSKLKKFKSLAQAAFEPTTPGESTPAPPGEPDASKFHGTERLKGARLIPIDRIRPDSNQPRKDFPEKPLQELADSIAAYGVLQPLTVFYAPASDAFTIVTGERRYRAARRAGLRRLPCIVLNAPSDQERLYQQLVENLQRDDITPFEEADAFRLLAERVGLKHQQIAQIVAKSRTYVTKTIGIGKIPEPVRRLCADREITSREQLILVAQQKTESAMLALLEELDRQGRDVRSMRKAAGKQGSRRRKNRPFEFRYQADRYTVRVSFTKHKVSKQEIAMALAEALKSLQKA